MPKDAKTIIVTGGAGFVGAHLCERLAGQGHRVISLDNYFTGTKENHKPGVEYREGHTKDIAKLFSDFATGTQSPDIIFHLGEYSRTEESVLEPDVTWDLNIAGTFGVLEFWRAQGCKLVYAGSSTKFADGGMGRDQSPYAFTKATNTQFIANYASWYSLPFAITYFYNVFGPGERSGKYGTVIEIYRQRYLAGQSLQVRGSGDKRRIFTHVDDIVDGLVLMGEKGEGDEFGLGALYDYSILEIARMFNTPIEMVPDRAGNRSGAVLDRTKSSAIGWEPKHDVADYIAQIIKEKI